MTHKIVYKNPSDLIPYANNARTHSDEQVLQIASSIKEFGFNNPVLLDKDNGIIAGHGRVEAAKKLGLDSIPTICLDHLSDAQRRAYILADNRIALNSGWDNELLSVELLSLEEDGINLADLGFTSGDLDLLLPDYQGGAGNTDDDSVPEVTETPKSVLGDLWILGNHRLKCGDSTNANDVSDAIGENYINLMVTDPPYGVEYDADWRNHAIKSDCAVYGASAIGKVENDDKADWSEAWSLFSGNIAYVWHSGNKAGVVQKSLEDCGFKTRAQIIWAKNNFAISRGDYHWKHEPCWYVVRDKGNWCGDRSQTTLWNIDKPLKSDTGHSTQKPIECMQLPIENNSKKGDFVYDPFLGSGTTLIAAEKLGRKCCGLEISPAYVDVIIKRWQEFTGKQAVHAETGKTFDET